MFGLVSTYISDEPPLVKVISAESLSEMLNDGTAKTTKVELFAPCIYILKAFSKNLEKITEIKTNVRGKGIIGHYIYIRNNWSKQYGTTSTVVCLI